MSIPWLAARLSRGGALAVIVCLSLLACAGDDNTAAAADRTIGQLCDRLLPSFCTYAVGTCGVSGTVDECVSGARPSCCQGTCQRAAKPVCAEDPCPADAEDQIVAACLLAYTGSSTPIASTGSGGSGGSGGAMGTGISCTSLKAGFAPAECREVFQLLSAPWPAGIGRPQGHQGEKETP